MGSANKAFEVYIVGIELSIHAVGAGSSHGMLKLKRVAFGGHLDDSSGEHPTTAEGAAPDELLTAEE